MLFYFIHTIQVKQATVVLEHTDFHYMNKQVIFKKIYFAFLQKKVVKVWNDMRVNKRWQNWHFWVNDPFKSWNAEESL